MGVVVGFVAIALVTAMYGIYKQVNVGSPACPPPLRSWVATGIRL